MRKQITFTIMDTSVNMIDMLASKYDLTRGNYLELVATLSVLEDSNYNITNEELDSLFSGIISKTTCSIRKEFRELHKRLDSDVKKEILKFLYKVNLIEGVSYSCVKQANFSKNDELIFYYGILDMQNTDIGVYIGNTGLSVITIGKDNDTSDKYIYLSNKRYFTRNDLSYKRFNDLCSELGIKNCECIKVHYKELNILLEAIKNI